MQHVYDLALVGLTHIALTERDQGQHDDADGHRTENSNSDVGFEHGGSSDGLSLQDISPEELWDALVTAIEEGEAHGSGGLGELGLDQLGPDQVPVVGPKVASTDDACGSLLNGNAVLRTGQSVCIAVLPLPNLCIALYANGLAQLGNSQAIAAFQVLVESHE